MHLSTLSLTGLRQFKKKTFKFSDGFNLLVGENGAGKTTIIRGLLAAIGGAHQSGPYPKLEDEDIRLSEEEAEVEAKIFRPSKISETFCYRKKLWEQPFRSHPRKERPLVLSYASNEATCSSMKGRSTKRIGGIRGSDTRQDEGFFYYGPEKNTTSKRPNRSDQQFGDSRIVREFLGRVLSTFSPDFQDFYWRFEPYDCSLVFPTNEHSEEVLDKEVQKGIRSFALRYFAENQGRPYDWPDQNKVILFPGDDTLQKASKRYLPDPREIWDEFKSDVLSKSREILHDVALEVKLTPRIIIQRKVGPLQLNQLSDGEQRLFSLFVNIARELSLRQEPDRSLGDGEAIVVIDEIDVHLHPKWQRQVIPLIEDLFPNCQFIATTHSPFVIQSVRSDSNLVLLDGKPLAQLGNTGIEEIAQVVMDVKRPDVSTRYAEEVELAKSFLQLLDEAEKAPKEKLEEYIDRLRKKLEYAQNPAMQAFLELEQASRLNG